MDKKIIAIFVVVIVIVVAAAVAVVVISDDDDDDDAYTIKAGLPVYGNADENYTIDSKDLDIINDIINGSMSFSNYPYADANHDGSVTQADADLVQKIINKEPCTIYHVNFVTTGNVVVDTKWPATSALSTGSANMLMLETLAGVSDKVHGICYSKSSPPDSTLFPTFSKMTSLGSSSTKMTLDSAKDTIDQYKVTTFIVDHTASTISNEADFEAQGIDVVRVDPAYVDVSEYAPQLLLLGFLFDTETQAQSIVAWEEQVMADINKKLEGVEKVSAITCNGTPSSHGLWLSAGSSDYIDVIKAAGATFPLDIDAMKAAGITSYSSGAYFNTGDTWLYDYDFDYIVSIRTGGWYSGTVNVVEKYDESLSYLANTQAYKDGHAAVITGDAPIILRVAYAATVLHPDIFTVEWANQLNEQFFENFYPYKIDFTNLFFEITYDTYSAAKAA